MSSSPSLDQYVEQTFPIQCRGWNVEGQEVLITPVVVRVKIHKSPGSDMISSLVTCPYNEGSHGQNCVAVHKIVSNKEAEKYLPVVPCAYAFDLPQIKTKEG